MRAYKQLLTKLKKEPEKTGIATDFDGTISEIVPLQTQATINENSRNLLLKLQNKYHLVAVVSGRPVKKLASAVGIKGIYYVGNHGAEYLSNEHYYVTEDAQKYQPLIKEINNNLKTLNTNGYYVDYKKFSLSVHYRQHPNPQQAEAELSPILDKQLKSGLKLRKGRMVYDISVKNINKGLAVDKLVNGSNLSNFIFFGDDKTDIDAFMKMRELRDKGLNVIRVALESNESPPDLVANADVIVNSVNEVNDIFNELLN